MPRSDANECDRAPAGGRSFGLELGKQDDVSYAFLAQQHHTEAIDADSHAPGRGHSVFKSDQKVFVELLLFSAGLMFETFALFDRIILLGICRGDFLSIDAAFKDLDRRGILG